MLTKVLFVLLTISMFLLPVTNSTQTPQYDVLIKGGRIVDGTGRAAYLLRNRKKIRSLHCSI